MCELLTKSVKTKFCVVLISTKIFFTKKDQVIIVLKSKKKKGSSSSTTVAKIATIKVKVYKQRNKLV